MGLRKEAFRETKQEAGCLSTLSTERDGTPSGSQAGSQVPPRENGAGVGESAKKERHLPGKVVEKSRGRKKHPSRLLTLFSTSLSIPISRQLENLHLPDCHIQYIQPKEFTVGHLQLKKARHFAFRLLSLLGE